MPDAYPDSYFEKPAVFIKKLYEEGRKDWEETQIGGKSKKDYYNDCLTYLNDWSPVLEAIPVGEFAPAVPRLSPGVELRLSAIETLEGQSGRPLFLEPIDEPAPDDKDEMEAIRERCYARLDYALKKTGVFPKISEARLNAETYPVAWLKGLMVKKTESRYRYKMVQTPTGSFEDISEKQEIVYIGPDIEVLQPEQVLYDPQARNTDIDYCRFIIHRDWKDCDYILAKWKADIDGNPLLREDLLRQYKEVEDVDDRKEAIDEEPAPATKGIEIDEMVFRVYDKDTGQLRLRKAVFLPTVAPNGEITRLEDQWYSEVIKGPLANRYPFFPVVANTRTTSIAGKGTVEKGMRVQDEVNDTCRMRLEAEHRTAFPIEVVKQNNIINPKNRTTRGGERLTVSDITGWRLETGIAPNIGHFVQEQQMWQEILLDAIGADSISAATALTNRSNETATLTARREAIFNSRIGRTYDNYSRHLVEIVEFYYYGLQMVFAEGMGEVYDKNIWPNLEEKKLKAQADAMAGLEADDSTIPKTSDLFYPFKIEALSFQSLAKRDIDKMIWDKIWKTLLPLVEKPLLTDSEIVFFEEYWRKNGESEKVLQAILAPKKAKLKALKDAGLTPEDLMVPPPGQGEPGQNGKQGTPMGRGALPVAAAA